MKMAKLSLIFFLMLLVGAIYVSAEYAVPEYGRTIECDPNVVAQIGIEDDCDTIGDADENIELAKRDCTQRMKPKNVCGWTEKELNQCFAVVEEYCGTFNAQN